MLGVIACNAGEHDRALELIRKAIRIDPSRAEYHAGIGALHATLGQIDQAIAAYSRAAAISPGNPQIHNELGVLYLQKGMADEAISAFQSAIRGNPGFAIAYVNLGNTLERSGRRNKRDEAIAAYRKAIAIQADFPEAYYGLACSLKWQHNLDEAMACYRKALEFKPDFPAAILHYSDTLLLDGRPAEASDAAKSAIRLESRADFPHYFAGEVLAKCGLRDDARRQLQHCLAHDPEDAQGAGLILAALGFDAMPSKTPDSVLRMRYDRRAHIYDQMADRANAAGQPYRAPEMVARALRELCGDAARLDILDAGCGTGLAGALVRDIARRLEGVDLSPPSLTKAAEKNIYDELFEGDLLAFTAARPQRYDAVAAAGILIHFNDLQPVFEAVRSSLRDGGVFVFTAYPVEEEAAGLGMATRSFFDLIRSGCYPHSQNNIAALAEAAGFAVECLRLEAGEYIDNQPIATLLVALRRRTDTARKHSINAA